VNSRPLKLAAALDLYFEEHVREHVIDQQSIVNSVRHLKNYFEDKALKDVGMADSKAYRRWRLGKAKSGTVAKELRVLKAAAHHCVRWKHITAAELPAFEKMRREEPRDIWLFKDELDLLKAAARPVGTDAIRAWRTAGFIELAYYTGSRKAALERLTWDQVDLENNRINLAQPGERRTKKRRPTVPLDPSLKPTLLMLQKLQINKYVLFNKCSISPAFKQIAEAAGLLKLPARGGRATGVLTPHVLRHSRATHLLQDGKTPWQVAGLLGDTVQTVTAVYGHHCSEYLHDIFN